MKPGDFMILNRDGRDAEVVVLHVSGPNSDYRFVKCACGAEFTVHKEDLRPVPRVRLDMNGRVALHVVEDDR